MYFCGREMVLRLTLRGFESIGLATSFEDVLAFFMYAIDDHEQAIAQDIAQQYARRSASDIDASPSRPKPG